MTATSSARSRRRPRPRLYWLHRWIGLPLAVVGTLVFFSGVLALFATELGIWATRGPSYPALTEVVGFDFDRALAVASEGVDRGTHRQIVLEQGLHGPLHVYFEAAELPEGPHAYGVDLDPQTLASVASREGSPAALRAPDAQGWLARFVVELHVFLLLPQTLGLLVTGLVGVGLLVLVVSGVWVHQPTRAKLRRRPRRSRLRVFAGDLHTLVGSWTLPYTLVLAATGAFFCFSSTVVLPLMVLTRVGGDRAELIDTIVAEVGVEAGPGTSPLAPIVDDALERAGEAQFRRLQLDDWGEPNARATVVLARERGSSERELRYVYAGHDGALLVADKPEIGAVPSLASETLELIDRLHFGTLFGRLTQLLWAGLGLATCGLSATGLIVHARRQDGAETGARLAAALAVSMSAGLLASAALVLASWAVACACGRADPSGVMSLALLLGLGLSAWAGWRAPLERALAVTLASAGLGWIAAPLLVALANGLPVHALWSRGPLALLVAGDVTALGLGLASLAGARALFDAPGLRVPKPTRTSP